MIATQKSLILQYDKRPRLLKDFDLSIGAEKLYMYIYNVYTNSTSLKGDNVGQYLTICRKTLASVVKKSIKTVIKYIKELVDCGLICDRRMGVKEVNRIYLNDVDDKYKYKKEQEENPSIQEETKSLIKEVKEIVAPLEQINSRAAKRLLIVSNSNLDIIRQAMTYTAGQSYKSLIDYMCKVVMNKWYETKPTNIDGEKANKFERKQNKKRNKFTTMYEHGWDLNKIQAMEDERLRKLHE